MKVTGKLIGAAALGLVTGLVAAVAVGVASKSSDASIVAFFVGATLPLVLIMGMPTKIAEVEKPRDEPLWLRNMKRRRDDEDEDEDDGA